MSNSPIYVEEVQTADPRGSAILLEYEDHREWIWADEVDDDFVEAGLEKKQNRRGWPMMQPTQLRREHRVRRNVVRRAVAFVLARCAIGEG